MFKHYTTITIRNLLRQKVYSFINVLGLAIGMACCLLIFIYIQNELSYDRHHTNNIYRVITKQNFANNTAESAKTPRSLAQILAHDCPEVLHATRLSREHAARVLVHHGPAQFYENGVVFADPNVFDVFTLPLVTGNPQTALQTPFSIVITKKMAQKYFGNADPIGQKLTLRLLGDGDLFDYTVTAIAQDMQSNSHFMFDFLAAYQQHPFTTTNGKERKSFERLDIYTYLTLHPNTNLTELESKLPHILQTHQKPNPDTNRNPSLTTTGNRYTLQPLTDIHLHSHFNDELRPTGDITYVSLFAAIAFFILLLACINFANLATARSATRAREIGVRKMFGSHQRQLVWQFLAESTLLSLISLILSVGLVEVFLPVFNQLANKSFEFGYLSQWHILPTLIGLSLFVGVLAGMYPAFYLSKFHPAAALKASANKAQRSFLRSSLVVFQFVISIGLMIGTVVILNQINYMSNKKLGFESEQVLIVEGTEILKHRPQAFQQAIRRLPGVLDAAHAESMPGRAFGKAMVKRKNTPKNASQSTQLSWMFTGFDYVETMGMKIIAGRSLSSAFPSDSMAVLLNEQAVTDLGLDNPIGQQVVWQDWRTYTIVGVVENFHFSSLHQSIGPLMMIGPDPEFVNRPCQLFAVRLNTNNLPTTLAALSATWNTFAPQQPFTYTFLNADLDALYHTEQKTGTLFSAFSALAIFIACLGLFGLAAFTAEQRTKEIGIRKTLGATVLGIVILLSKDFLKLVTFAFVVVIPIAYFGMRQWLNTFTYRINLGWEPFALVGTLALIIALSTVGYQSLKAALTNPIDALRDE